MQYGSCRTFNAPGPIKSAAIRVERRRYRSPRHFRLFQDRGAPSAARGFYTAKRQVEVDAHWIAGSFHGMAEAPLVRASTHEIQFWRQGGLRGVATAPGEGLRQDDSYT